MGMVAAPDRAACRARTTDLSDTMRVHEEHVHAGHRVRLPGLPDQERTRTEPA